MTSVHVIAEAAQGFEGSPAVAELLVRAAAVGGADAVKFQIVFADDLCTADYAHAALFRSLEMDEASWRRVREEAARRGLDFVADVFGPRSLAVARATEASAVKLHSTTFFDDALTRGVLEARFPRVYLSVGGIAEAEIAAFVERHGLRGRDDVVVMFGYQAEPTPVDRNALARIPVLRERLGLEVGFMDHSDGDGPDTLSLSAMALALGVRVFEKHVTLDRGLELEDYVSALAPRAFKAYAADLKRLAGAMGSPALALSPEEIAYRGRALKRVVAARDLPAGTRLSAEDIALLRPGAPGGLFVPAEAVGRILAHPLSRHQPIDETALESRAEI